MAPVDPGKSRKSSGKANWLLPLLALPFAAVGSGCAVWLGFGIVEYLDAQSWKETPAKIIRADWKCLSSSSRGNAYQAVVEYKYAYQGQSYTGQRISLDKVGSFEENSLPELRESQKSRQGFHCYVNPKQPAEAILYRNAPWSTFAFQAVFVIGFGGVGFGLLSLPLLGRRGKRKTEALARAHPGKPWLWKQQWADGTIRASAQSLVGPLIFAIGWNSVCIPMWYGLLSGKALSGDRMVSGLVILFIVTGLCMIVWAVIAVRRWRKFGRSVFEMASVPGVIGGQLAGTIRTPTKILPEEAFCVRLSCVSCTISRADRESIVRSILWQDEQFIARDTWRYDAYHSAIPVLFQIPYECRPTDDEDLDNVVFWRLEVTAKTPGLDYQAEFIDVPVFKTPESDPHFAVDQSLIAKNAAPEDPARDLRDAGVLKIESPAGDGCRFIFPMARQPFAAVMFTLLSLIILGVPVFLWFQDSWIAAAFLGTIFGLAGLLLSIFALNLWFYRSVVDVSRRGLTVIGGLFGLGAGRWIDASEVVKIITDSHLQSDTLMYCDLIVVCRDGRKVTACKRLPGKRLANSVIRQIEQAMGKPSATDDN